MSSAVTLCSSRLAIFEHNKHAERVRTTAAALQHASASAGRARAGGARAWKAALMASFIISMYVWYTVSAFCARPDAW